MSKRFATIFFITVATIIILCVAFFLVLFLAPGISIFGLKYIGKDLHAYNSGKVNLNSALGESYTGIVVNTYEVPIYVEFTEDWSFQVEYYDNYNGLTTTKMDTQTGNPTVTLNGDAQNMIITTKEYHKTIYETSTSTRYLKLYVPIAVIKDNYKFNLTINSTKSDVTFTKTEAGDISNITFNTVKIKTTGKIVYGVQVNAVNFDLEASSSITINEKKDNTVNATNYKLKSTSGKIAIKAPIDGDLNLETKNGSISLISCKNLYATTTYGNIKCAGEGLINLTGIVEINTKSGNVTLGNVTGGGTNKITTSSGSVKINKINDGEITTKRGSVTILSVDNFKIETNVGKVNIQEAISSLNVKTRRGRITLGGENMTMNNITAESTLGRIIVKSASGVVNISTASSNIDFTNLASEDITISCGGKLTAKALKGNISVKAAKNSDISFTKISGASSFEFGAECKQVNITALENTRNDTGYNISCAGISIYEYKNNAYITVDGNASDRKTYEGNALLSNYLHVKAEQAKVNLYVKAPA